MKKYRRIEITAFRRRVSLVSGEHKAVTQTDEDVCINDAESQDTIEMRSAEGQAILLNAIRILEENLQTDA